MGCAPHVEGCALFSLRKTDDERRERIAAALEQEVVDRNEWYGLDNWSFREVVDFVLDRYKGGE